MNRIILFLLILMLCFKSIGQNNFTINELPAENFSDDTAYFNGVFNNADRLQKRNEGISKLAFSCLYRQIITDSLHPSINQLIKLSNIFFHYGEVYRSIRLHNLAYEKSKLTTDTLQQIKISNWLGYLYTLDRDYSESFRVLTQNLALLEKMDNHELLSMANLLLGFNFRDQRKYDKAKIYFRQALLYSDSLSSSENTHISLNEIGNLYVIDSMYNIGLKYLLAALKIRQEKGQPEYIGYSYNDIGVAYFNKKQYNMALEYFFKAIEIAEKTNDNRSKQRYYLTISDLYTKINKIDKAEKYIQLSRDLAISSGENALMPEIYNKLMQIEKAKQNYKKALYYAEIERQYNDSVINIESVKKISELESRFEIERIETQLKLQKEQLEKTALIAQQTSLQRNILILAVSLSLIVVILLFINVRQKKRDNRLIKNQKEEIAKIAKGLAESNATKDKFFSIIAHDLRNPFNLFIGYTELLMTNTLNYEKQKILEIVSILNRSANSTFQLLENLLLWARTQNRTISYSPSKISLAREIKDEMNQLSAFAQKKEIKLQNELPENLEIVADNNMIKTILRNLVSNAVKFTPRGGTIRISVKISNVDYIFSVNDSGMGMKQETIDKLFKISENNSTKGTEQENGSGLGLILCKEFVEQHNGKIWAESQPGLGSTFYFSIPYISE